MSVLRISLRAIVPEDKAGKLNSSTSPRYAPSKKRAIQKVK
jgi:hypothetical protein